MLGERELTVLNKPPGGVQGGVAPKVEEVF
jgi:hypothetical protein